MPRNTTAWAAVGAVAVLMLSGCRFFGIDTRPDIRYVTEGERKEVSEPMYSMPVPGTGLFKQWPMRLGPDYGYAPWERKPNGARPTVDATAASGGEAGPTMTGAANAHEAASPNAALAASSDAPNSTKPSSRATPRLAGGELAAEAAVTAADRAPAAAEHGAAAGEQTHLVAGDFDVPVAARGSLDFRTPAKATAAPAATPPPIAAQPQAAAAMVARPPAAAATRPPVAANLPWRSTGDDGATTAAAATGSASSPTASGVALQQPGVFSARKVVAATAPQREPRTATTSPRNVLRDEAVRPASAEMPVSPGSATPRNALPPTALPTAPAGVPSDLIPPSDDHLGGEPGGEFDDELDGGLGGTAGLPAMGSSHAAATRSPMREAAPAAAYASPYASAYASQPVAAPRRAAPAATVGTPMSKPGPRVVRPSADVDGEEPVFVTASDMGDANVPVARAYANPYYRPGDTAPGDFAGGAGQTFSDPAGGGVLGELEAAKQSILR